MHPKETPPSIVVKLLLLTTSFNICCALIVCIVFAEYKVLTVSLVLLIAGIYVY